MDDSDFYTLTGYRMRMEHRVTEAMEDYLEMIYRTEKSQQAVRVGTLAEHLHVQPSSVSRMLIRLRQDGFLQYEKYGLVSMTQKGREMGEYLLWRHDVLQRFFCRLNGTADELSQVEQVEHFMQPQTVRNLEKILPLIPCEEIQKNHLN